MRRRIAWKVLRLLYRDRPFVFAQRITFTGGVEATGDGAGVFSHCTFGDGAGVFSHCTFGGQ